MKFGFEMGFLYDLRALYQTTINCELKLLVLAERYELAGIHVISANTDGLLCKIPLHLEAIYKEISDEWCKEFSFELEYATYSKYVRTSVNDYLAIKDNGEIKTKGDFMVSYEKSFDLNEEFDDDDFSDEIDLRKGYGMPIVVKAVNAYFTKGIPIKDYIHAGNDIYDFCLTQKIGGQFLAEYHTIKNGSLNIENVQKDIRYFVSDRGGVLIKKYKDKDKRISIQAKQTATIFNDWFPCATMLDYNIDYKFYVSEAMKIINTVSLIRTKDMKKYTGKMFDDL